MADKISDRIDVYTLDSLDLQIYWAIDHLSMPNKDRVTLTEITKCIVDDKKINITKSAIFYALRRNKKEINKNINGYKLMKLGEDVLDAVVSKHKIIIIEPNTPYSSKKMIADEIFKTLKGTIKLCDPYFSIQILDHIGNYFNKSQKIQILTENVIDKSTGSILRCLGDLKKEGHDIEVRIYDKSEMHDRYIIDEKLAWLAGYGFSDIGRKECFFVLLGEDIRQSMLSTFNNRWKISKDFK